MSWQLNQQLAVASVSLKQNDIKRNKESIRKFAKKFDFVTSAGKRREKTVKPFGKH